MPGPLRALLSYVLLTAVVLLLDGATSCFRSLLGDSEAAGRVAALFTLFPVALGAFHRGAGHPPLRARYLLLGFLGAAPLASGLAPLSGLLILPFLLPLRALGAQVHAVLASHRWGLGLLALATPTALALSLGLSWSLSLLLLAWALGGLLFRYLVPPATAPAPDAPTMPATESLFAFLLGLGLVSLGYFLKPYFSSLDSGATDQDLHRLLGLSAGAALIWLTFGLGFGESKGRRQALAATSLGLALSLPWWSDKITFLTQPEGYQRLFASPFLRKWLQSPSPILPEDHPAYAAVASLALLALPLALGTIALRCLRWPTALAPFLLGVCAALIGSLTLGEATLPALGTVAASLLFATALAAAAFGHERPAWASVQVAIVLLLGGLFLRSVPTPTPGFPLPDAFPWAVMKAEDGSAMRTRTLDSLPRWLERESGEALGKRFLADGRNLLQAPPKVQEGAMRAALFAATLAPTSMERVAVVGSPDPGSTEMLARLTGATMTVAADPPALGRMAFRLARPDITDADDLPPHDFRASLSAAEGPFDLILIQGQAWWESRHAVLRRSLLRQAKLRLDEDGVCVFTCRPEQLVPGVLPAWLAEFKTVFPNARLWLLPTDIEQARLVLAGSLDAEGAWPTSGELPAAVAEACARLDLPLTRGADRDALEIALDEDVAFHGGGGLFQAPWPAVDRLLAPTAYHPEAGLREIERAAAVLTEALSLKADPAQADLLDYYAAELGAQRYSVHDTYLTENPYAIEMDEGALEALYQVAAAHPASAYSHQLWRWATVALVEQREIAWLQDFMTRLEQELGWQDAFVLLGQAHAAMEMLDFEGALALIDRVLKADPSQAAALEMRPYAEAGQQLPRDEHAGHDHR